MSIYLSPPKAALFIETGEISLDFNDIKYVLSAGQSHYITSSYHLNLKGHSDIILIQGNWDEQVGNSGFFTLKNNLYPGNTGDPVNYKHYTKFDNHYHDFNEIWIILKGSGTAISEGIQYEFEEGDCILTMMGDHHDLPFVKEEIKGIYFETSLRGKKRLGHLWNHTHGNPGFTGGKL